MSRNTSRTIAELLAAERVESLKVDKASMAAISNVFRVATVFRNVAERSVLDQYGLSFSGFTVLWVLWLWGRTEPNQLVTACGVSKGTLSGVTKTLQKLGYAELKPHEADRRRVYVQLSRKGRLLIKRIFPRVNAIESEATADLTNAEKKELARKLRIILHSMNGQ